jgi:tartrate dehydratase alpha subunit/fumarate hydratase class I-like protein
VGGFIVVMIFLTLVFSFVGFTFWILFTKEGQRVDRKVRIKQQVKQGMRDAEIEDGLLEEVVAEIVAKKARTRVR